VLANGQCMLIRVDLLAELGGFREVRAALCEDVTLARLAARAGERVGFFEAPGLVEVAMFDDWRAAWTNWPRSLTTRDALFDTAVWLGLLEVLFTQGLPVPMLALGVLDPHVRRLNLALLAVRLGMLLGISRAYAARPLSYWLSPLLERRSPVSVSRDKKEGAHGGNPVSPVLNRGAQI